MILFVFVMKWSRVVIRVTNILLGIHYFKHLFIAGMAIRELVFARFVGGMGDLENSWLAWPFGNGSLARN